MGLPTPEFTGPAVDKDGRFLEFWRRWLLQVQTASITLVGNFLTTFTLTGITNVTFPTSGTLATVQGAVQRFALAAQPTLGTADAGTFCFVTDYAHLVYWDGTAFQWGDGDQPYRLADFTVAPATGWAVCDGTATTVLVVGAATLTTAALTTPALTTTPSYKKSAAAYTGALNAASGSTATGTSGTGTTGTGTTGTGTTGTGTTGSASSAINDTSISFNNGAGVALVAAANGHVHTVPGLSIPGLSVPGLSVPGLSVPGLTVPALAVGTLDMANLAVLPYVRR